MAATTSNISMFSLERELAAVIAAIRDDGDEVVLKRPPRKPSEMWDADELKGSILSPYHAQYH